MLLFSINVVAVVNRGKLFRALRNSAKNAVDISHAGKKGAILANKDYWNSLKTSHILHIFIRVLS